VTHIRTATTSDIDALIDLRTESETWLHAAGIRQWIDHARGIRSIRTHLDAGKTFVVIDDDGATVASLTLAGPDLDFWTPADRPDDALYLYKFMITEQHRGSGMGDELLDWACDQAERAGKRWLRLDCWRDNHGLQAYYLRRGFTHVRTEVVPGRDSGAIFQRPASLRTATTHFLAAAHPSPEGLQELPV
jgi:GNAT superfamily N-acetyltransferase